MLSALSAVLTFCGLVISSQALPRRPSSQDVESRVVYLSSAWPPSYSSSDYGWNSWGNDEMSQMLMEMDRDPQQYSSYSYSQGWYPPSTKRPRSFLQVLKRKANRKFKSLQGALTALGVTPQPPTTTTATPPVSSTEAPKPTGAAKPPSSNAAVQLILQLAPTISQVLGTVGNAIAGEGSLIALKRDAVLANLKFNKALFLGLPETIIKATFNLPSTVVSGKQTLLKAVGGALTPPSTPPMPMMMGWTSSPSLPPTKMPTTTPEETHKVIVMMMNPEEVLKTQRDVPSPNVNDTTQSFATNTTTNSTTTTETTEVMPEPPKMMQTKASVDNYAHVDITYDSLKSMGADDYTPQMSSLSYHHGRGWGSSVPSTYFYKDFHSPTSRYYYV